MYSSFSTLFRQNSNVHTLYSIVKDRQKFTINLTHTTVNFSYEKNIEFLSFKLHNQRNMSVKFIQII